MPKVGIMVDVSAEIYENVILPAKAEKRFNKLVSTMLETYYTNERVRAFVDGKEEEHHLSGMNTLQEQIAQATQSAAKLGIVGDSLRMSVDSAKEEFSSFADGDSTPNIATVGADLEEFKNEIREELRSSQQSFMEDMRSMMAELFLSKGVNSEPVRSRPVQPIKEEPLVVDEVEEVVKTPISEPKVSGDDVLKNLLGDGNIASFGVNVWQKRRKQKRNLLLEPLKVS